MCMCVPAHAGRGGKAEGTVTLIMMRWEKAWRDIKGADRQRKDKIDV